MLDIPPGMPPLVARTRASRSWHISSGRIAHLRWQDGPDWLGYLEDYPDYMTQGGSLDELRANLLDLYRDLTSGELEKVRRVGRLQIA